MTARRTIERLAIVNRGEAAMRCVRAVKALRAEEGSSLQAIALYTDADRDAPFVRQADAAYRLDAPRGEVAAYLDHDALLAALRRARADAAWPGWGFVAEDPAFADRVAAAGICFLGPSGDAMRLLGDKIAAKRLAESAGVPVSPWTGGAVGDLATAEEHARRIGFPLVVKAAAGGGGRGIRVVASPADLAEAFRAAGAEATSAFGDGRLFLERKVERGRHVEVQIARDEHGHAVAFGCRDCSVQRRHQKVLEEAPPPGLSAELLAQLAAAALRLADGVGYVGVGTVEFLVAGESFFFLEVNPRLQVEHGVTETTTGIDLVRTQIRIARGEHLADVAPVERGFAMEARVCAEDPAAGFLPSPGRIARFDPAFGPRVRLDTGVVAGNTIPSAFDSLIAKVIASGETREEARARLVSALRDFDLVVAGGATNKGWLIELLESPEVRAGGVDTGWLDRRSATHGSASAPFAAESLLAASILAYQRRRRDLRRNFYADTTHVAASRVPPSAGQAIELSHDGERYRLQVFALGSWRYRVHLDGRAADVTLREGDDHVALLTLAGRTLRVLHDQGDAGVRIEVEGRPRRFGWQTAGELRAVTPAMVVAVHVAPGDAVAAGQPVGLLEAMKMEIAFAAPVAGVVREVRVRAGQQVAAGDVLLVIDASGSADAGSPDAGVPRRIALDPTPEEPATLPGLAARDGALRAELRAVLLGYDADPARVRDLLALLEECDVASLAEDARGALEGLAAEVVAFADVEQLFVRAPRIADSGRAEPSNEARLRLYVRRVRARGAGLPDAFLDLVRAALARYGIAELEPDDALERALLRLFATRGSAAPRRRLLRALLRVLGELGRAGAALEHDAALRDALARVAEMRDLVGDELADDAIETGRALFVAPVEARDSARVEREIEAALRAADDGRASSAADVVHDLAEAPDAVFARVAALLADRDPRRRALALAACVERWHAPLVRAVEPSASGEAAVVRLAGGRTIVAAGGAGTALEAVLHAAVRAVHDVAGVAGAQLFVGGDPTASGRTSEALSRALARARIAVPVVVSWIDPGRSPEHWSFAASPAGFRRDDALHGVHPETARRVGLERLGGFDLARLAAPDGFLVFHGRSRAVPDDERVFVLAEVRGRSCRRGGDESAHVAAFERAFREAAGTLRATLAARGAQHRLQWNRIVLAIVPEVRLGAATASALARRLAPATHRLGIDRVLVRLALVAGDAADAPARDVEMVVTNVTGRHVEITPREPAGGSLVPATRYDRKVVAARRRRLVYPYEIVRLLCEGDGDGVPGGSFAEHDLEPDATPPRAVSVAGRAPGENASAVVFGIVRTPTAEVPEGMRRVLILSDPTIGMGALAAPECDRVCAALDLAEELSLPVEWVPISSGARIAMDSGTENLDATARVVRRIVSFTERGGVIHVIVYGTNVGAQSYWNALATMLMHCRGALVMTPQAAMVLTGRKALEASGSVAADDEVGIGGYEHVMGPNGEAQYYARDLVDAFRVLYEHHRFTYVVPGESAPRRRRTTDAVERSIADAPYPAEDERDFRTVGEIFDDAVNPGRKRPFAMRPVMQAVVDRDCPPLERWAAWTGAETAIVWDASLGGTPVCLIGIESRNVARDGYRPLDGPSAWTGGTLFPASSKKVARALNAASGVRPAVILANLSGFDGSPESMRKLQLEHGAEIARAVVRFAGPLLFVVVSRYHGGAYVVFSKALNDGLHAAALEGSYASVIGGAAAASVVFDREVRKRALDAPAVRAAQADGARDAHARALEAALQDVRAAVAAEFDAVHSVARARDVGSLDEIVALGDLRALLVRGVGARTAPRDALQAPE